VVLHDSTCVSSDVSLPLIPCKLFFLVSLCFSHTAVLVEEVITVRNQPNFVLMVVAAVSVVPFPNFSRQTRAIFQNWAHREEHSTFLLFSVHGEVKKIPKAFVPTTQQEIEILHIPFQLESLFSIKKKQFKSYFKSKNIH